MNKLVVYLLLVAVGFYFGRYVGALGCVLGYWYFFPPRTGEKNRLWQGKLTRHSTSKSAPDWAYHTLDIAPDSDWESVKKARKKQLNRYHPDKLPADASAQDKQRASDSVNHINRAFDLIKASRQITS